MTEKLNLLRSCQPSAIRSSIVMLVLQVASFVGSFILMGLSVYIYGSAGRDVVRKGDKIDANVNHMKQELYLSSGNSTEQAYLVMVSALLLLLIWKLATMVRRRNAYILLVDDFLENAGD